MADPTQEELDALAAAQDGSPEETPPQEKPPKETDAREEPPVEEPPEPEKEPKGVLAKDGEHFIPMRVVDDLRESNKALREQLESKDTPQPDPEPNPYEDLDKMSEEDLVEYGQTGAKEQARVFKYVEHRAVQKAKVEATKVIEDDRRATDAQKLHRFTESHDYMKEPMWRGAAEALFDQAVDEGKTVDEALEYVDETISRERGGDSSNGDEPPNRPDPGERIEGNVKEGRHFRSLAGVDGEPGEPGASPTLARSTGVAARRAYENLSPEQQKKYRHTGRT